MTCYIILDEIGIPFSGIFTSKEDAIKMLSGMKKEDRGFGVYECEIQIQRENIVSKRLVS